MVAPQGDTKLNKILVWPKYPEYTTAFVALFSNYLFSTSFQQTLLQSCSGLFLNFSFHYSLNKVPSFYGFPMFITNHEVEKCSFLTQVTGLKSYLSMHECTSFIMNSSHISLYVYMLFEFFFK